MLKGGGRGYPKAVAGEGQGIIVHDIDKKGNSLFCYEGKRPEIPWDYERYDIELDNIRLKSEIEQIVGGYSAFEEYLDY